jgi:hypothetical protein
MNNFLSPQQIYRTLIYIASMGGHGGVGVTEWKVRLKFMRCCGYSCEAKAETGRDVMHLDWKLRRCATGKLYEKINSNIFVAARSRMWRDDCKLQTKLERISHIIKLGARSRRVTSTQPLTEMSTRNLPGRPAHKADNVTAICEPIV